MGMAALWPPVPRPHQWGPPTLFCSHPEEETNNCKLAEATGISETSDVASTELKGKGCKANPCLMAGARSLRLTPSQR